MTTDHAPRIPLAGVMGWPISHSRSPALHGHWLARLGLPGHYVPIGVEPRDFEVALRALPLLGFRGVNVTLPHKEAALRLAHKVSDRAALIGAANTLTFRDGVVVADNTDGYGFIENLRDGLPGFTAASGPALVLGAGGAARAVVSALLTDGAPEVRIANRTRNRAEHLAEDFGARARAIDWLTAEEAASDAALIVNSTSLGMTGQPPLAFSLARAAPGALVTDLVYAPLETRFLAEARARGMMTVDGLGMLLHQGRPGFEAWFGGTPTVDAALRAAVLDEPAT